MMMTDGFFATARIQAERADAARDNEADVAVAQFVGANRLDCGLHQFGVRQRNFQQNRLGGIKQPVNVFLQFEHAAIVGADALEHAVAVKQTVVEHGHFGVAFAAKFSINVNFHAKVSNSIAKNGATQT
jgi:hypothetical protein